MLTEHRKAITVVLGLSISPNEKVERIEGVISKYLEWLDSQIAPATRPWYEYTSTDPARTFREGDVIVHLKTVAVKGGGTTRILSLRHKDDVPIKDWNFFFAMKCKYLGMDAYAVEVYPPVGEIRDSSFTYHLFEVPFPIGFETCLDGGPSDILRPLKEAPDARA